MTPPVHAAVALVVCEERALVLRRCPTDRSFASMWCLPGGRVEPGEAPADTAIRETAEETGLAIRITGALGARTVRLAERRIEFLIHCFVARADAAGVTLSEEHVDARWLTRAEASAAGALLPGGLAGEIATELLAAFAAGELG